MRTWPTLALVLAPSLFAGCFFSHGSSDGAAPPAESEPFEEVPDVWRACGDTACAERELCVVPCHGAAPRCVPTPATTSTCDTPCGCFAVDPCDVVDPTASAACISLEAGRVTCACAGPELPPAMTPTDWCARYLDESWAGDEPVGCDGRTFRECSRTIEGIPCCQRQAWCEVEPTDGGWVREAIVCDDSCAQLCDAITVFTDCLAFGCEWVGGACR